MIYLFVFIAGVLMALMQSFNGVLSGYIGLYGTSFIVHLIGGVLLALYILIVLKQKIKLTPMPWYLYTAGIFGLILVAFTSLAISKIGVAFATCLSIAGQLFFSIIIDHFGLFGVKKVAFQKKRIPALLLIALSLIIINFAN
ncbi:MAG: DMT family transporter [Bacillaceae bacterium]